MALVEAAYRSAEEGRRVALTETMPASVGLSTDAFRLDGRVAIVTGGGGGLGEGICLSLAAAGASVAVVDRDEERCRARAAEVEAAGGRAIAVVADVSSKASIDAMADRVAGDLGRHRRARQQCGDLPASPVDGDHGAGVGRRPGHQREGLLPLRAGRHPWLVAGGRGRIVNMASITLHGGWDNLLSYVTSKGGVLAFTRALARELGPEGITVNCIAPGAFPTDAEKIHPDPEGTRGHPRARRR